MLLFFMMKHIFKNNKEHYTYGGLYGSSGSYILGKIAREFNTVFIVLSNNSEIVNLSKELKSVGIFPAYSLTMISAGEETGQLVDVFDRLSTQLNTCLLYTSPSPRD